MLLLTQRTYIISLYSVSDILHQVLKFGDVVAFDCSDAYVYEIILLLCNIQTYGIASVVHVVFILWFDLCSLLLPLTRYVSVHRQLC